MTRKTLEAQKKILAVLGELSVRLERIEAKRNALTKAELSSVAGKLMEMRHARDTIANIPSSIRTSKQEEALSELSRIIPKVNLQLSIDLATIQSKTNGTTKNASKQLISGNSKKDYTFLHEDNAFSSERKTYKY